jgi:phosphoenolpyruvate carboxylase
VPDEAIRDTIFAQIEAEFRLTVKMVQTLTGSSGLGTRFPKFHARLQRRLPAIDLVSRQQIELLRLYRSSQTERQRRAYQVPLLLSINCIASGFGATG